MNRYEKGKANLDLLEQETLSGSGISWAICKSASRPRQITMPAPTTQFLQAQCPSCYPTNSVKALKAISKIQQWPFAVSSNIACPTVGADDCAITIKFTRRTESDHNTTLKCHSLKWGCKNGMLHTLPPDSFTRRTVARCLLERDNRTRSQ